MAGGESAFVVDNTVCIVTGGAAGVGAGIVKALLRLNARHVAFLDINEKEGSLLEKELNNKFGALRAKFIKCDVADETELNLAYSQVIDKYARLDIVINNAAVLSTEPCTNRRMVDVNFVATMNSTFKAVEIMRADKGGSGGTIVNISALLALSETAHLPVYAATKAAVLQFSNILGMDTHFNETAVRILTICFGPTDTAIYIRHNEEELDKESFQCLVSTERQRVESAVNGILEALKHGKSGSTWKVANDNPAEDITDKVVSGLKMMSSIA